MRTFERVAVVIDDQAKMVGGSPAFVAMGSIRYAECEQEFRDANPLAVRGGIERLLIYGVLLVKDPLVSPGYFYPVFRV